MQRLLRTEAEAPGAAEIQEGQCLAGKDAAGKGAPAQVGWPRAGVRLEDLEVAALFSGVARMSHSLEFLRSPWLILKFLQ